MLRLWAGGMHGDLSLAEPEWAAETSADSAPAQGFGPWMSSTAYQLIALSELQPRVNR